MTIDAPVDTPPTWRYWGQMYAFLVQTREWAREANDESDYLLSTRARDTFEAFQGAFEANRIRVPSPSRYPGAEYLDAFIETTETIIQWIPEHV